MVSKDFISHFPFYIIPCRIGAVLQTVLIYNVSLFFDQTLDDFLVLRLLLLFGIYTCWETENQTLITVIDKNLSFQGDYFFVFHNQHVNVSEQRWGCTFGKKNQIKEKIKKSEKFIETDQGCQNSEKVNLLICTCLCMFHD